jgi:acyl-CoA synthetase (AMP-forming)/AMP-acid ligase II
MNQPDPAPPLERIGDYVGWHAARTPSAEALVVGDSRLDYRTFGHRVEALACALIAAGIKQGDRVATLSPPHPDFLVAFLAIASIGGIWVGLNPRYRLGELSYIIRDAEPRLMFTRTVIGNRQYSTELSQLRAHFPGVRFVSLDRNEDTNAFESYEAFVEAGTRVSAEELTSRQVGVGRRDPCLIVYTSGSTGRPKGALLTHEALIAFSLAQNRIWPVRRTRALNYFPINHVGCVVDISCPVLVSGGCIVFMEQFEPAAALALMESERITLWASLPTIFQMQLSLPSFAETDLSAVELIVWEGAAMPEEMIRALLKICPRLATNYGLTETTGAVTVVAPTNDIDTLSNSVGAPFPGVEIRLADATGSIVKEGETGEIQVRSIYNMIGYWRREADTSAAFLPGGWLLTGDLGLRRPDGTYRLVGRLKEMYKSGGYNVYPREIETVLETFPGIQLAAVIGVSDPLWQEVGIAYVVAQSAIDCEQLDRHCRANLANYKVPKRYFVRTALPLLPIGKVDKMALREDATQFETGAKTPTTC